MQTFETFLSKIRTRNPDMRYNTIGVKERNKLFEKTTQFRKGVKIMEFLLTMYESVFSSVFGVSVYSEAGVIILAGLSLGSMAVTFGLVQLDSMVAKW